MSNIKAGAAWAPINIQDVLPMEGFTIVRDDLTVRLLIVENGERFVIASMDMTSLPEDVHDEMISLVSDLTGAPLAHVWLTLTHSFAGPHIFPAPKPGKPQRGPVRSPEELAKMALLREHYESALKKAAEEAVGSMREAQVKAGAGESFVNIGRNVFDGERWVIGPNPEEPVNRKLSVLRVDDMEGNSIATVFNYSVRSSALANEDHHATDKIVTYDLGGEARKNIEDKIGGTAIFLCGGAADLNPREEGAKALASLGAELGGDVLKVREGATAISGTAPGTATVDVMLDNRDSNPNAGMENLIVTDTFEGNGRSEKQTVYMLDLGGAVLLGVKPEMDGICAKAMTDGGALMAVCMVNGSGKSMPSKRAYELKQYTAFHSPFMPGSAEKMAEAAISLIESC